MFMCFVFIGFFWLPSSTQEKPYVARARTLGLTNERAVGSWEGQDSLPRQVAPETPSPELILVSHYSAIGDTISCDALYSAIVFRGKLLLRYSPC